MVHNYITQEFGANKESKEMIDLLFLSHFDSDHVNGLEYLQPHLSSKTRVFLPFYYAHMQSIYDRNKREDIEYVISILGQHNVKPIETCTQIANKYFIEFSREHKHDK